MVTKQGESLPAHPPQAAAGSNRSAAASVPAASSVPGVGNGPAIADPGGAAPVAAPAPANTPIAASPAPASAPPPKEEVTAASIVEDFGNPARQEAALQNAREQLQHGGADFWVELFVPLQNLLCRS